MMIPDGGMIHNIHYGDILTKYPEILSLADNTVDYLSSEGEAHSAKDFVQDGDIIIADTAEDEIVGKVVEVQDVGYHRILAGLHTMFYRPPENLFVRGWLGYWMNSCAYHNQLFQYMTGIKVLSLSKASLANTVIQYPSKREQTQIVTALDAIQKQINALTRLLTKYESLKKATVKLLGYPKKGWSKIRVGSIGEWFKGHGVTMKDTISNGIPCTMYGDIYVKYKEFFVKPDYYLPIDKATVALHGQYGDLLFTASGETAEEIGKCSCYIGKEDLCIGGDIIVLRPSSEYDCKFLSYLLNSPACIHQKACLGQGDAVVHIKQENLQSIELYIPQSLEEQLEISAKVEVIDKTQINTEKQLQKLLCLKQSMLQYFFG